MKRRSVYKKGRESHTRKSEFTGRRNDYNPTTLGWARSLVAKWKSEWPPKLRVVVSVWREPDGQMAHGLFQEFTPDAEGVRSAKKYARELVEQGVASMTWINAHLENVNTPGRRDYPIEDLGSYEPEEKS